MTRDHHYRNTIDKTPPEVYATRTGHYGANYSFVFSDNVKDWYTSKTNTRQAGYEKKKLKMRAPSPSPLERDGVRPEGA